MKKQDINKLQEMLNDVKAVLSATNEDSFEELGSSKKTQILNIFALIGQGDTDGDSDGVYMSFKFGKDLTVVFESKCRDIDDFEDYLSAFWVDHEGSDQDDNTIAQIDKALRFLDTLNPPVIGLLNTSILTAAGDYSLQNITLSQAIELANNSTLDSAVGHASTAQIMTTLLNIDVPVNRQMFKQEIGQQCLVFKLRGRPEEGKILTAKEIEDVGYDWQLLTRKL